MESPHIVIFQLAGALLCVYDVPKNTGHCGTLDYVVL